MEKSPAGELGPLGKGCFGADRGLEDTVVDADDATIAREVATGFKFGPVNTENLAAALRRAHAAFHDKLMWQHIQRKGMSTVADSYREIINMRAR
jgi:glycogen synthase